MILMKTDNRRKRDREKEMVSQMIELYCRKKHREKALCPDCRQLLAYTSGRIEHCPHMETKTFCSRCKTHCYAPAMREKIREVMRFSGPWMMLCHPGAAMRHMADGMRGKRS